MALSKRTLQGDGEFTKKCVEFLADIYGHDRIILTPSGTHALELASMAAQIGKDSKVRMPSYNFSSDGNAVRMFGGEIDFVDVDINTGSTTSQYLFGHVDDIDAVSFVNYAGLGPDVEKITEMAKEAGVVSIEDNAHGLGGSANGRTLGTFGDFSALSFHSTKNYPIGEGGALVVNNETFWEKALVSRDKGTNRHDFISGKVDKYKWQAIGSSHLMNEISSAFLLAQLEDFEKIQQERKNIHEIYSEEFSKLETSDLGIQVFPELNNHVPAYHFYFILVRSASVRSNLLRHLSGLGLPATSHYEPLHSSPFGIRTAQEKTLPNSIDFSERVVRLPLHHEITKEVAVRLPREIHSFLT